MWKRKEGMGEEGAVEEEQRRLEVEQNSVENRKKTKKMDVTGGVDSEKE